ncbi:MAG: hypothetical protein JWO67_4170 [Streptosporangiaceae bacterium]|nr:hypothetical protein [Streptosporangiaceae bacterium]
MTRYLITDEAGNSGTVTVQDSEVAAVLHGWYPDAPAEVYEQVDALQEALLRGDVPASPTVRGEYLEDMSRRTPAGRAAQYLAVRVEQVDLLADVRATTERLAALRQEIDKADSAWREAIRTAVADGGRVIDVAAAAGISRERVYQIRDGRR